MAEDSGFQPILPPDPDFDISAIVGYKEGWRSWEVHGDPPAPGATVRLYSVAGSRAGYFWQPRRESKAECTSHCKETPGRCGCGFYSAKTYEHLISMCVPLDAEILTPAGWKRYDAIEPGDLTLGLNPLTGLNDWTPITAVQCYEDKGIVEIGNEHWDAVCTVNHRWVTQSRARGGGRLGMKSAGALDRKQDEVLLMAAPHRTVGGDFTPAEAALVAWLVTDGHWAPKGGFEPRSSRRTWGPPMTVQHFNAQIIQKKSRGIEAIEKLVPIFGLSESAAANECRRWTVPQPIARDLWERIGMDELQALSRFVLSLSSMALESFMEAAWLAEGNDSVIYQNEGPVLDALVLGAYRQGYHPRVHRSNRDPRHCNLSTCSPRVHSYAPGSVGREDVWCPTTELGTWTMRHRNQVHLTGNSYHRYDGERGGKYCVIGRVANWGKVVEGTLGWRAELAYPLELFVPFEVWKLVEPLHETYGVPVQLLNFLKPRKGARR